MIKSTDSYYKKAAFKGRKSSTFKQCVPVVCIDDEYRNFHAITVAAKHYRLAPKNIKEVCEGKRASAGGLRFGYGFSSEYLAEEVSSPEFKELKEIANAY